MDSRTNQIDIRLKAHKDNTEQISYLVVEIIVDGKPLCDFDTYAIDLGALIRSIDIGGEFYIITCWCGYPGCAGIDHGVLVQHNQDTVSWIITDLPGMQKLEFMRTEYERAIRGAIKQGNRLIAYLRFATKRKLEMTPDQKCTALRIFFQRKSRL